MGWVALIIILAVLVAMALRQGLDCATSDPLKTPLSDILHADEAGLYKPGTVTTADGKTFVRSAYSGGSIDAN